MQKCPLFQSRNIYLYIIFLPLYYLSRSKMTGQKGLDIDILANVYCKRKSMYYVPIRFLTM